ncbi:type II secretion system minor pseudopilin GspK [Psychrobacter pygoscelis]|uniref:type II secretion system minor pseudopilin GspK n=1 Tax=Psychrobacter pygoscelis TaxID=2488563 RepID=UPI0013F482D7|nr:type II secretion system minor pseudopilin GspK [Psychrobacter pygoscelis]
MNRSTYKALPKAAQRQQGVALLTILLLVVSITVVAGAMLASQKIAIRQSGLLFEQNQLLQDIAAAQQLAVALIRADNKLNDTDSLHDVWAQPIPPYPMGTHVLTIEINDEASRFNINNLYHDGQVDAAALATFKRLLAQVGIEESVAVAVLDWQDPDTMVFEDSAEEAAIYGADTLHNGLAASATTLPNQPFYSVDQLSEINGVSTEALALLRPYVTAVPYYLPVNVNTALPEVLAAMMDNASPEQMQAIVSARESTAIDSLDSLWQIAPFASLPEEARNKLAPLLTVDSQAFLAIITATDSAELSGAQAPKQRYATVMISKVAKNADAGAANNRDTGTMGPQPESGDTSNNSNNSSNSSVSSTQQEKVVQAFSQRLWPYRPINVTTSGSGSRL